MWIKNPTIARFAKKAVQQLPDYFFTVAASSTGKYHPQYALGNGGLVRHTKAAVGIAHDLLSLEMYNQFSDDEKDLIIVALMLHDGKKHGDNGSKYTVADHPAIMADWLKNNNSLKQLLLEDQINMLCNAILCHMGEWNKDRSGKEIMPKPTTPMQRFVHLADYLASRKYLEYKFENNFNLDFEDPQLVECKKLIIDECKKKLLSGANRDDLYNLISKINDGNKNPNSIRDVSKAKKILEELVGKEE